MSQSTTGNSTSTLWAAFVRSAWSMIAAGLVAAIFAYQQIEGTMPDDDAFRKAVLIGLTTALGPFVVRGGIEGAFDARRQRDGTITPADVTDVPSR